MVTDRVSVTALHVPYKTAFEPIVNHGEYVAIPEQSLERLRFFRVLYIEPIPWTRVQLDSIEPGKSMDSDAKFLELEDNELGQ